MFIASRRPNRIPPSRAVGGAAARAAGGVRHRLHDPLVWGALTQNAKIVVAAVVAWVLATDVLSLNNPVLAPWAAVLVVHTSIYRTVTRGTQQAGATVLAVVLAWSVGNLLGTNPLSLGVALALAFLVGRVPPLRSESTTLATTTIVVLGTGYLDKQNVLLDRLLDTFIGIGVGLAVNLLVWPPMRDRAAAAFVDDIVHDIGGVLADIASGLGPDLGQEDVEGWLTSCREIDTRHDEAWVLVVQARESVRFNPRRRARRSRVSDLDDVLHGLEQSVAEVQSMVRTIGLSIERANTWQDGFRGRWSDLLEETAAAIATDDAEGLEKARRALRHLTEDLSTDDLRAAHWPEYGGLIVNLRNVVTSMIGVATWRDHHRSGDDPHPAHGRTRIGHGQVGPTVP